MPRRFQFTEKTSSKRALLALILAGASIAGLLLLIYGAVRNRGTGSAYIGSAGVCFLLLGVVALIVAIRSLREENSFPTLPRVGMFFSVLACLLWVALYAWGFTL